MELSPIRGGYSLAGVGDYCSGSMTMPRVKLRKNDTFTVDGMHHTSLGAASYKEPIRVTGTVSVDGQTLKLTYSAAKSFYSFSLNPGPAKQTCPCIQM